MTHVPRMVTVQDFSCFGKSSMAVALPAISAAGVEAVALPTALLSTHTTGFTGYSYLPLTDQMAKIIDHWRTLGIPFDAIHTGYLAHESQIPLVCDLIEAFAGPNCPVVVDPAMGDDGALYDGFAPDYPEKMRALCRHADILTPNVTEACLLCGKPYQGESNENGYLDPIAEALSRLARGGCALITGVLAEKDSIGVLGIQNGERFFVSRPRLPAPICGAGDLFSTALTALLVRGASLKQAVTDAARFLEQCIRQTQPVLDIHPYGLRFEPCLPELSKMADSYK